MTLLGGLIRYSFDTSAFINGRRSVLPHDVFPTIWAGISDLIDEGVIRASDAVADELKRRDDDAFRWVKARPALILPLSEEIQLATKQVLVEHKKLVGVGQKRNGADPFVIGLASAYSAAVVTEEIRTGNLEKPRIPDVCDALKIPCFTLVEFVRHEGWQF